MGKHKRKYHVKTATAAGCGNPEATTAPTEAPAQKPEVTTAPTEAPAQEPEVTTVPTEAPAKEPEATTAPTEAPAQKPEVTTAPTEAPAKEPEATTAPTEAPTEAPAGSLAQSPEEQAWIDAIYAAVPKFKEATAEHFQRFVQGDTSEDKQYTAAYEALEDALGTSAGWDELSVKLSPYAYAVDFEWRDEGEKGGTYLLQSSDGRHLALLVGENDNDMYMYLIDSDNPRTNYGFKSLWGIVTGEGMDELTRLKAEGKGEDFENESWVVMNFNK